MSKEEVNKVVRGHRCHWQWEQMGKPLGFIKMKFKDSLFPVSSFIHMTKYKGRNTNCIHQQKGMTAKHERRDVSSFKRNSHSCETSHERTDLKTYRNSRKQDIRCSFSPFRSMNWGLGLVSECRMEFLMVCD